MTTSKQPDTSARSLARDAHTPIVRVSLNSGGWIDVRYRDAHWGDRTYEITMNRVDTPAKLLAEMHYLTCKPFCTADMVQGLIHLVCELYGWTHILPFVVVSADTMRLKKCKRGAG